MSKMFKIYWRKTGIIQIHRIRTLIRTHTQKEIVLTVNRFPENPAETGPIRMTICPAYQIYKISTDQEEVQLYQLKFYSYVSKTVVDPAIP